MWIYNTRTEKALTAESWTIGENKIQLNIAKFKISFVFYEIYLISPHYVEKTHFNFNARCQKPPKKTLILFMLFSTKNYHLLYWQLAVKKHFLKWQFRCIQCLYVWKIMRFFTHFQRNVIIIVVDCLARYLNEYTESIEANAKKMLIDKEYNIRSNQKNKLGDDNIASH